MTDLPASSWESRSRSAPAGAWLAVGAAAVFAVAVVVAPLPALGAGALVSVLAVALVRPDVATVAAVFLLYTNAPTVAYTYHEAPYLLSAMVVPGLLGVALMGHLAAGKNVVATRAAVLVALLLAVEVLATAFSPRPEVAAEDLLAFTLEGVVLFLLVLNAVRTPSGLRAALWAILFAAGGLALMTVHQQVTSSPFRPYGGFALIDSYFLIGRSASPRATGPIGDANYFAQILVAAVPIGLMAALHERRWQLRLLGTAITAVIAGGIMITDSRGAFVALVIVLAAIAAFRQVRGRHVTALVVAAAVLLALMPAYAERLTTLVGVGAAATAEAGTEAAADQAVQGRSAEMRAAALTFADHPILGVGPGAAPEFFQQYAGRLGAAVHEVAITGPEEGTAPTREAHNMLLTVLAETGLVGGLVFIGIVAVTLLDLGKARRRAVALHSPLHIPLTAVLLALIGYLAAGLFLSLAFERYFWLLLGLAGAATLIEWRRATAGGDAA